ncbi:hypothetical protein G9A89_010970 [Geosiphon pyriformis]|nr:hypothetical protein G9A89_010970 [Geosiphon pyriformis]
MFLKSISSLTTAATFAYLIILGSVPTLKANNIAEIAKNEPSLSFLNTILNSPGYEQFAKLLSSDGNYTVFAPNDNAFKAITASGFDGNNKTLVSAVLKYHVVAKKYTSKDFKKDTITLVPTLLNDTLVNLSTNQYQEVKINSTSNGILVNNAKIIKADVSATNGVIHIIDTVLVPPSPPSKVAQDNGLSELVNALKIANLTTTVDGLKGVTIFAPTNEAFKDAKADTLNSTQLAGILKIHVINRILYSTDLKEGDVFQSLGDKNETLKISVSEKNIVTVNGSPVSLTDVLTSNGVVHVITKVITKGSGEAVKDNSITNQTTSENGSNSSNSSNSSNPVSIVSMGLLFGSFVITFAGHLLF